MIVQLLSHMYSHWERKTPSGEVEGRVNLFKQQKRKKSGTKEKEKKSRDGSEKGRCYMAQLSGGGWRCWFVYNQWNAGQLEQWRTDWQTDSGGAAATAAAAADREVGRMPGVKTARCELRHESMNCKNKQRQKWWTQGGEGGSGWGANGRWGIIIPLATDTKASFSLSSLS